MGYLEQILESLGGGGQSPLGPGVTMQNPLTNDQIVAALNGTGAGMPDVSTMAQANSMIATPAPALPGPVGTPSFSQMDRRQKTHMILSSLADAMTAIANAKGKGYVHYPLTQQRSFLAGEQSDIEKRSVQEYSKAYSEYVSKVTLGKEQKQDLIRAANQQFLREMQTGRIQGAASVADARASARAKAAEDATRVVAMNAAMRAGVAQNVTPDMNSDQIFGLASQQIEENRSQMTPYQRAQIGLSNARIEHAKTRGSGTAGGPMAYGKVGLQGIDKRISAIGGDLRALESLGMLPTDPQIMSLRQELSDAYDERMAYQQFMLNPTEDQVPPPAKGRGQGQQAPAPATSGKGVDVSTKDYKSIQEAVRDLKRKGIDPNGETVTINGQSVVLSKNK